MKIIITEEQRKSLNEMIKLDIKVGDTLMGGKFKNKKVVVKTIGKNDKGDITINGKPLLRFRILKEDDSTNRMIKLFKNWLYSNYDDIAFLETKTYDGLPLIVVYHTTESNAANYDTWLAMEIMDNWNKFTSDTIPVMVRWSNRISSDTKILIDVEEYHEEKELNESVNSKMDKLFDNYMKKLHPEFLRENITMRMSSGEDTLYIYDSKFNTLMFIDLSDKYSFNDKHLYFRGNGYVDEFSNVFGYDTWAELFLNWANKEYEPKLKSEFNEIDWEITGVD